MAADPRAGNDADLVSAVARGDRDALTALYHRHARELLVRLHRRCADAELVDTALQDTFLAVWRSAGTYRADRGEVGAWLWTIALRKLVDQLRRRRPPTPVDIAAAPSAGVMGLDPEPLPPPGSFAHELLSRLPPDLHAVVQAVYLDGLTTAEAGVLLGIPQGTVKSRLARARPLVQEVVR